MDIQIFLAHTRTQLHTARGQIDAEFDAGSSFLDFVPAQGGWNGREILEHVVLTQHFLLKLTDKAGEKVLRNLNQLELAQELAAFAPDVARLEQIGLPHTFAWERPEHMEPTGAGTGRLSCSNRPLSGLAGSASFVPHHDVGSGIGQDHGV